MLVSIKEASQITGISLHTLRYYEKQGIIKNIKRDELGNRKYSSKDLNAIYLISCLKATGMSLKNIEVYLKYMEGGRETVAKRYELIFKQQQLALKEMEQMKQKILVLEDKLEHYSKVINDDNYDDEWMSKKIQDYQNNTRNDI